MDLRHISVAQQRTNTPKGKWGDGAMTADEDNPKAATDEESLDESSSLSNNDSNGHANSNRLAAGQAQLPFHRKSKIRTKKRLAIKRATQEDVVSPPAAALSNTNKNQSFGGARRALASEAPGPSRQPARTAQAPRVNASTPLPVTTIGSAASEAPALSDSVRILTRDEPPGRESVATNRPAPTATGRLRASKETSTMARASSRRSQYRLSMATKSANLTGSSSSSSSSNNQRASDASGSTAMVAAVPTPAAASCGSTGAAVLSNSSMIQSQRPPVTMDQTDNKQVMVDSNALSPRRQSVRSHESRVTQEPMGTTERQGLCVVQGRGGPVRESVVTERAPAAAVRLSNERSALLRASSHRSKSRASMTTRNVSSSTQAMDVRADEQMVDYREQVNLGESVTSNAQQATVEQDSSVEFNPRQSRQSKFHASLAKGIPIDENVLAMVAGADEQMVDSSEEFNARQSHHSKYRVSMATKGSGTSNAQAMLENAVFKLLPDMAAQETPASQEVPRPPRITRAVRTLQRQSQPGAVHVNNRGSGTGDEDDETTWASEASRNNDPEHHVVDAQVVQDEGERQRNFVDMRIQELMRGSLAVEAEAETEETRNRAGKLPVAALVTIAGIALVAIVVGAVVGVLVRGRDNTGTRETPSSPTQAPTKASGEPTALPGPNSFVPVATLDDLHTAIDQYLNDTSNSSTVAMKYGHPIGLWDVSGLSSLADAFNADRNGDSAHFNADLSQWNISGVTSLDAVFHRATDFNSDLSEWDTSRVTSLVSTFAHAHKFNGNVSSWDTSRVTSLASTFLFARQFNGNLRQWNISRVTALENLFESAVTFNSDLSRWDTGQVTSLAGTFSGANKFNADLSNWKTARVTSLTSAFSRTPFNSDLSSWDVARVTSLATAFHAVHRFNSDLSRWKTARVIMLDGTFSGADRFNGDLSSWNTARVTSLARTFEKALQFNANVSGWNISSVTTAGALFSHARLFNADISAWDTARLADGTLMFEFANEFNGDISRWKVGRMTNMVGMFTDAFSFNGDLSRWDVSRAQSMDRMFASQALLNYPLPIEGNTSFNRDISGWRVRRVTSMKRMFFGAANFDRNLCPWGSFLSSLVHDGVVDMFRDSNCPNQDDPVIGGTSGGLFCHVCSN